MLHLDVQRLDTISNLSWRHVEQARGLGLYPTGLFQRSDNFFAFVEIGVVEVQFLDRAAAGRDLFADEEEAVLQLLLFFDSPDSSGDGTGASAWAQGCHYWPVAG